MDSRCAAEGTLPFGQRVVFALAQGATAPPALRVVVGSLEKEGAPVCIKLYNRASPVGKEKTIQPPCGRREKRPLARFAGLPPQVGEEQSSVRL